MRLTRYTDYAMRVLLYLGAQPDKGLLDRRDRARLRDLTEPPDKGGYEPREGGLRGRCARAVGRHSPGASRPTRSMSAPWCAARRRASTWSTAAAALIAPACGLTGVLDEALAAFMAVLDRYTLADLLKKRSKLLSLFAAELAKTAA